MQPGLILLKEIESDNVCFHFIEDVTVALHVDVDEEDKFEREHEAEHKLRGRNHNAALDDI